MSLFASWLSVRKRKTFSADVNFERIRSAFEFESNGTSSKMKILILKFWYVACTIFCLYSLNTLVLESYEVAILAANKNEVDPIRFLVCKDLSSFQINKTEVRVEELKDEMVDHLNRSNCALYLEPYKRSLMKRLETGQYMIFDGLLCILLEENEDKYYIKTLLPQSTFLAFKKSTLDFAQQAGWYEPFDQLLVQKKGPPYSNCNKSNGRFRCLNECFKNILRLSRYLYDGNETGLIYLKPVTNQTIENEKICFEKCWRENCDIVQFVPFSGQRKPETTKLAAQAKMSKFDFYVQFIGLVCSFANISLNHLTKLGIKFAISKVKRRKVRIGLLYLKWAIIFLSLAFCSYLYTTMTLSYQAKERNPDRKEIMRHHIKQNSVRLVFCVDIKEYLTPEKNLNLSSLNQTMSEIEKATNSAFDNILEGIYLNYQGRMFRMDYILEPKVLFKKLFVNNLFRCFSLLIRPDYQLMPSNPTLALKFKEYVSKFYLLTEDENLNEKTLEYTSKRAFLKRVVKKLERGGCVNYQDRYVNCTSRRHCVERCINKEALERFKKINIDKVVVDKDQFNTTEWNRTYPMTISYRDPNSIIYKNISGECEKKIQVERPCLEVTFNETVEIVSSGSKTTEIDLFLDIQLSIEELSWFKLLLDILTIQNIFFGMTVLKLLRMLCSFFKLESKNNKIVMFLIYLLCSIGFTWHTYYIFELGIKGELTYSPNYEVANRIRMPTMIFCLPVDEKLVDRDHQLTGNYLDQLTSEMSAESLFKSITYLNDSNEWTSLNLKQVDRFFFMHLKCFNVTINQEYHRRQFHFSINTQVLKVNFTDRFLKQNKSQTVFFMTKTNETIEFSNVVSLFWDHPRTRDPRYSAEQSENSVNYEDHLSFIKRFL